jgi:threonylcarbamoyladenosine tRNA methylthiotransferase MtaB
MKVFLDSIGCRLNQSEIEKYARHFRIAGHTLVPSAAQADLVVVNTCAVTQAAVADSKQKIRQAARSGEANIAVTGCWSTLNPSAAVELPGVTHVIPNGSKDQLVSEILQLPAELFDKEFIEREPVPGLRLRTRAFIKVQDGCDNRCTFCITTVARGKGRSRPISSILDDIAAATAGGAQEIVLTGVHLGSWGYDFDKPTTLKMLVQKILVDSDATRIRLSSLEPWDLSEDFFELWQDARLCRHLHLPLQSGCATTLRRMARKTTPEVFERLVQTARQAIPNVAITTDIIVGFPGETENEFTQSLSFVEKMKFADGHVFTYSSRPGTAAARMPQQVTNRIRKERNALMRQVIQKSTVEYQSQFVGEELPVLFESASAFGPEGWRLRGLTDNYLRVIAHAPQALWNSITPVRLEKIENQGFQGRIIEAGFPPNAYQEMQP